MNENVTNLPNGIWPSPVTAGLVSQRLRFDDVQWTASGGTLVWTEGRSSSIALVSQAEDDAPLTLTDEQTPRGGVGYGGGTFTTARAANGDYIIFANKDGRLYRRSLQPGRPYPITPAFGPNPSGAVAAPSVSPDGQWVLYVYSDGKNDLLAVVDSRGEDWPVQFARGADFYMAPAWHPGGGWVAWVEWDHPHMPWDETRIQLARIEGAPPRQVEIRTVGGGPDRPAAQPLFSPDGAWLSFIEEAGEWPNVVLYDLASGERKTLVQGDGFDISSPAWVQGIRTVVWSADSQKLYYLRQQNSQISLWAVDIATGQSSQVETGSYTWLSQLAVSPATGRLAFLASSPTQPDCIVIWDGSHLRTVAYTTPATIDPADLPAAREFRWPTSDGATAYGLYYAPHNRRYSGSEQPPALLSIHGGPTSLSGNRFNPQAAYFTSRGYAYIEVNYRGSTGYGRGYRNALRRRWGDIDVEDAVACARYLAEQRLADGQRLVIIGGSAGGYTVLNALARYPGVFKAGICLYGVSNLFALDLDTHKFEAHYTASLVGKLPEAAERYRAWSPVFHADQIRDALYIFQGSEDKVVPPSQSEEIVKVLRARGIPHEYKIYQGEGHGFRKSENIQDFLLETERFLLVNVLFS